MTKIVITRSSIAGEATIDFKMELRKGGPLIFF